jgi:hypothetical protein
MWRSGASEAVIKLPKKKYTPKQDVQLGKEAASEVRKQYLLWSTILRSPASQGELRLAKQDTAIHVAPPNGLPESVPLQLKLEPLAPAFRERTLPWPCASPSSRRRRGGA